MKIPSRHILMGIMVWGCIQGCINEVDFDVQGEFERRLVVDGTFTLGKGPHFITLKSTDDFERDSLVRINDAEIVISDREGNQDIYLFEGNGRYKLYSDRIMGRVGVEYEIEINWEGKKYKSTPQVMPVYIPGDSVIVIETVQQTLTESFRVAEREVVDVFINTALPSNSSSSSFFLRWETVEDYNLVETGVGPFYDKKTCYFRNVLNPQDVWLLDGSNINLTYWGDQYLASRPVDWTLGYRHHFSVYQYSLTEEGFEYWENVRAVINQQGSIFDSPPALVRGNVFNIDDPNEIVLGFFEVAAVDTIRTSTTRGFYSSPLATPLCVPIREFRNPFDPEACYNCLLIQGATTVRPPFFGE